MAIKNLTAPKNFVADAAISVNRLVKIGAATLSVTTAGAGERAIGVATEAVAAAGDPIAVECTPGAIVKCVASAAITLGAAVMAAAGGKVVTATAASTTLPTDGTRINVLGTAMRAAGADGDVIEVLWAPFERI